MMVLDKEDGRWLVAGGGSPAAPRVWPPANFGGSGSGLGGGREALPALLAPLPVPILILILILPSEAARCGLGWAVGRALGVSANAFEQYQPGGAPVPAARQPAPAPIRRVGGCGVPEGLGEPWATERPLSRGRGWRRWGPRAEPLVVQAVLGGPFQEPQERLCTRGRGGDGRAKGGGAAGCARKGAKKGEKPWGERREELGVTHSGTAWEPVLGGAVRLEGKSCSLLKVRRRNWGQEVRL